MIWWVRSEHKPTKVIYGYIGSLKIVTVFHIKQIREKVQYKYSSIWFLPKGDPECPLYKTIFEAKEESEEIFKDWLNKANLQVNDQ